MPRITLHEEESVQLNRWNKPYYYFLKKVDVLVPNTIEKSRKYLESSPLFSAQETEVSIVLYSRNKESHSMISTTLLNYLDSYMLENKTSKALFDFEQNDEALTFKLKGNFFGFIEHLMDSKSISKKISQEIFNQLNIHPSEVSSNKTSSDTQLLLSFT